MARPRTPLDERFWPKVYEAPSGCWLWASTLNRKGYGTIRAGGSAPKRFLAHRVAYQLVVGAIPAGLQLDHLCRVRHCVNPAHLEAVTARENLRRGMGPAVTRARHAARRAAMA